MDYLKKGKIKRSTFYINNIEHLKYIIAIYLLLTLIYSMRRDIIFLIYYNVKHIFKLMDLIINFQKHDI